MRTLGRAVVVASLAFASPTRAAPPIATGTIIYWDTTAADPDHPRTLWIDLVTKDHGDATEMIASAPNDVLGYVSAEWNLVRVRRGLALGPPRSRSWDEGAPCKARADAVCFAHRPSQKTYAIQGGSQDLHATPLADDSLLVFDAGAAHDLKRIDPKAGVVTDLGAFDSWPSPSADGSLVIWTVENPTRVRVRDLRDIGRAPRETLVPNHQQLGCELATNSTAICWDHHELLAVDLTSGTTTPLSTNATNVLLSPDRRWIVFAEEDNPGIKRFIDAKERIQMVSIDGTIRRQITDAARHNQVPVVWIK